MGDPRINGQSPDNTLKFIWIVATAMLLCANACTNLPELEATIPEHLHNAPYPKLVQLDDGFSTSEPPGDQAEKLENALNARRQALQARAKGLLAQPDDND